MVHCPTQGTPEQRYTVLHRAPQNNGTLSYTGHTKTTAHSPTQGTPKQWYTVLISLDRKSTLDVCIHDTDYIQNNDYVNIF